MNATLIPSAATVRARLAPMSRPDIQRLADLSGVPFHTLLKIRSGETLNPGIETVRLFAGHLDAVAPPPPPPPDSAAAPLDGAEPQAAVA